MKKLIVFCLLVLSFSKTNAQAPLPEEGHPSLAWHMGNLTLTDGLSIKGLIKYDLRAEAVHLKTEGTIRTFMSNQIVRFDFLQANIKRERKFITIPFEEKGGYKRPKLFEVLYENEISLLAREEDNLSNWTKSDPSGVTGLRSSRSNHYAMRHRRTLPMNYDYYLLDQDKKVKPVRRGAKGVARSFDDHYEKMRSYTKRNKLNTKTLEGMISLVSYYNALD